MEIDPQLRRLQLGELDILNEFVRICEKHNLTYYLVGGTLLGAVRHQGFIPWDDDIDVGMPREDYDRFAQIAVQELAPHYFYQSPDTDPCYFLSYAKIRKNGTEIYEERFKNAKFHKGIFIDIFPLDFCPKPGVGCHLLFNVLAVMNYRGQIDSGEPYIPYKELTGKIGYNILRLISPQKLIKLRRNLLRFSKMLSKKQYFACYAGAYGYYKEVFNCSWFGGGRKVIFERLAFTAPNSTALVVSRLYGQNYKIPPPKCQRESHIWTERINFGTPWQGETERKEN